MSSINLSKNIFISASSRIAVMALAFFTSLISTRFLGVELKGQYSYLITISSFAWLLLDLGISKTYPYLIRKEPQRKDILFTWSLLQAVLEFSFLCGVGLTLTPLFTRWLRFGFTMPIVLLTAGAIAFTKLALALQMYFVSQDKVKQNSAIQILQGFSMLMLLICGYLFFHQSDRLIYVLISYNVTQLISIACYAGPQLFTRFWRGFELRFVIRSYSLGWKVFLSSIFITLLIRFDVILIRRFLGFEHLGIYAVAANIVDMLQMASNLVGTLLLVKLSDVELDEEKWVILKRVLIVFFFLLGAANLGFVLVGRPLVILMYGVPFAPVYNVYLWLIPASFGLSFGSLFNTYLWSKGFPLATVLLPFAALTTNIGLNIWLIPMMGITGAALATSVSYMMFFVSILLYEHNQSGKRILRYLRPTLTDFRELWRGSAEMLIKCRSWITRRP